MNAHGNRRGRFVWRRAGRRASSLDQPSTHVDAARIGAQENFVMRYTLNGYIPNQFDTRFPFRRDNRRPDGTWLAPDATEDNIKGTSVDPHDPVWPHWERRPPLEAEGEFISRAPFFDIDEITQTAKFYPPGAPLLDRNLGGNPATRQRDRDILTGNHWRRRLLVGPLEQATRDIPDGGAPGLPTRESGYPPDPSTQMAFYVPSQPRSPILSDTQREAIAREWAQRTGNFGLALGVLGPGLGALGAHPAIGLTLGAGSRALSNPEVQQAIGEGAANKAEHDARQRVNDAISGIIWQEYQKRGGFR
jgi:hypothetical protein